MRYKVTCLPIMVMIVYRPVPAMQIIRDRILIQTMMTIFLHLVRQIVLYCGTSVSVNVPTNGDPPSMSFDLLEAPLWRKARIARVSRPLNKCFTYTVEVLEQVEGEVIVQETLTEVADANLRSMPRGRPRAGKKNGAYLLESDDSGSDSEGLGEDEDVPDRTAAPSLQVPLIGFVQCCCSDQPSSRQHWRDTHC